MALALRVGKGASRRFFVADDVFPANARRRAHARTDRWGSKSSWDRRRSRERGAFAVLLQYPARRATCATTARSPQHSTRRTRW
jgi:hypothetical protein